MEYFFDYFYSPLRPRMMGKINNYKVLSIQRSIVSMFAAKDLKLELANSVWWYLHSEGR